MNENELIDIADKLLDKYGCGLHWDIVKAEKTETGWNLTVQPVTKDGGTVNESNE